MNINEPPNNLGHSNEHNNGIQNGTKSSHVDIKNDTHRHADGEVLLTRSISNIITSTRNNDHVNDDEIKSSNRDTNISIPPSLQSPSNIPVHSPHNNNNNNSNNNSVINNDNNTNLLLQSITNKLQENIGTLHQLESKFDTSQKGAEDTLLKNNFSMYNKLEENVRNMLKTYHDDDNQKIQMVEHKIDSMMSSMLDLFKQESEKIDKKQMELTTLQVRKL